MIGGQGWSIYNPFVVVPEVGKVTVEPFPGDRWDTMERVN